MLFGFELNSESLCGVTEGECETPPSLLAPAALIIHPFSNITHREAVKLLVCVLCVKVMYFLLDAHMMISLETQGHLMLKSENTGNTYTIHIIPQ